ncbi:hypothetical protein GCM10018980_71200 [Streptomyces capoamus]|uniref:Secreted protein n=1 Tax=Streptomyces capoamus TaxID=68183 RepID=A0A919F372_9ACTN|nr:hypothetical protein [Streptomyces capoamus]GGW13245.1 hypothetical protein GCM10010501_16030 [Streptomyces libani subsp. rufus]GHG74362.1 hypothetical protein GCM10018980_71200 [Streptomyces capoamus]
MTNARKLAVTTALAVAGLSLASLPAQADENPTDGVGKLNQLNQPGRATQALDPVLGLLAPVTGLLPA